jgi:ribosome-associated protein
VGRVNKLYAKTIAKKVVKFANEKHAEDVVLFYIKKLSSIADYVVICSADSERQVNALARHIEDELQLSKIKPLSIEGLGENKWVLMDYNDVIVHIFVTQVRSYYDLEGLWADAERVELDDDQPSKTG